MTSKTPILFLVEACGRQIVGEVSATSHQDGPPTGLDPDIHGFVAVHNPLHFVMQVTNQGVSVNLNPLTIIEHVPVMRMRVSSWFVCPGQLAEQYRQIVDKLVEVEIARRSGIQLAGSVSPQDIAAAEQIRKMKVS